MRSRIFSPLPACLFSRSGVVGLRFVYQRPEGSVDMSITSDGLPITVSGQGPRTITVPLPPASSFAPGTKTGSITFCFGESEEFKGGWSFTDPGFTASVPAVALTQGRLLLGQARCSQGDVDQTRDQGS